MVHVIATVGVGSSESICMGGRSDAGDRQVGVRITGTEKSPQSNYCGIQSYYNSSYCVIVNR
jgi:hypothetical protein